MKPSWMEQAACSSPAIDPEMFFPISESGVAAGQIAAAKTICAQCRAADDCLVWALREEAAGIWGGTTAEERRLLRRARQLDRAAS